MRCMGVAGVVCLPCGECLLKVCSESLSDGREGLSVAGENRISFTGVGERGLLLPGEGASALAKWSSRSAMPEWGGLRVPDGGGQEAFRER